MQEWLIVTDFTQGGFKGLGAGLGWMAGCENGGGVIFSETTIAPPFPIFMRDIPGSCPVIPAKAGIQKVAAAPL